MNSDIANAAAYRPEDGQRMRENQILNDFDTELRAALMSYPYAGQPTHAAGVHSAIAGTWSRARSRQHAAACARAVARLHQAGIR